MSDQIKPKTNRAERPDKAAFRAFMGAFFLIACIPLAVWAYWSYADYQKTNDTVRHWREQPDSMPTGLSREQTIAIRTSIADRHRLEAILSGAGSLILFGGAILLFTRAAKARKNTPQYANIDWRTIQQPTRRVEVQFKRLYDALAIFLFIFLGGLTLLILRVNGFTIVSAILLFLNTAILLAVCYLLINAKRKSARLFDVSGITRNDNRHFSWNEFQGVVTRIDINLRSRRKYVWRIELAFGCGEAAWIIPNRIKNADEVFTYIAPLPRAVLKGSQQIIEQKSA